MPDNILITGATGFLGSRLLAQILDNTDSNVFLLIRPSAGNDPLAKIKQLLDKPATYRVSAARRLSRITAIEGDITKKGLAIGRKALKQLRGNLDIIFHLAAELDIKNSYKHISCVNTTGTINILDFALQCRKSGKLKKVNHVSTAYVLGSKGLEDFSFHENQLELSQGFNNLYEKTKYEAEIAVGCYRKKGLLVDVFRPSIITEGLPVTDYGLFSGFFRPFRFFISGALKSVPARADARYNFICVDDAARAIFVISNSANAKNRNYHIVNTRYIRLQHILDIASDVFDMPVPACIPHERFDYSSLSRVQKEIISPFVPYLNFRARFNSDNAHAILGKEGFRYKSLKHNEIRLAFEYIKNNKMRQKEL